MQFCIYLFIFLILICSCAAIFSNNPIKSVLFLALVFLLSAILLLLVGAEFVSLLVVIVYVGAISILFLLLLWC